MLFLIMCVLVVAALALGLVVGHTLGARNRLPSKERAELGAYREQQANLTGLAAQHMAMGDNFAAIVLDELNTTRRAIQ